MAQGVGFYLIRAIPHSMEGDLLVKNGRIVTPLSIREADILIRGGVIERIGRDLNADGAEVIDAKGLLVLPGGVDEHVHMREPGLTHKEDFASGTMAAAAGGITTILEMPNTIPPVESVGELRRKRGLLKDKAYVDFGLYGVLHDGNVDELVDMWEEGAVGFKVFLGPTTGNLPAPGDSILYEAMSLASKHGFTLAFHAENRDLVEYFTEKVKGEGRRDYEAHADSRPNICEEEAVSRLMILAKRTGAKTLIVHVSARETVELLREAKALGLRVWGETCPHYLLLTREAHKKYGSLVKVNPPLRDEDDRRSLWKALRDNVIRTIGSDHAPHTPEEKSGDIWNAQAGFIGVETMLPIMLDAALRGVISICKVASLVSYWPSKIFGLYPRKGSLEVGGDGDLVIIDPKGESRINAEKLHSKHKLTPFDGVSLRGRIRYTVLRGVVVAVNGEVVEEKPMGEPISPLR